MRVGVIRAFRIDGASIAVGTELDLPDAEALLLIAGGKAVRVGPAPITADRAFDLAPSEALEVSGEWSPLAFPALAGLTPGRWSVHAVAAVANAATLELRLSVGGAVVREASGAGGGPVATAAAGAIVELERDQLPTVEIRGDGGTLLIEPGRTSLSGFRV